MATHPTIDHPRVREDARRHLLAGLPVTERRLPLAGVSTAVLEGGDGPPVVLLHGPAGNAAHWLRVIPGLAATRRVIVPDLPGHGASIVDAAGGLDAERVGAWLGELIERTCSAPPVLVGYALGGAIALRFAADHADRLSGLVLVDSLGLAPFEPSPAFGAALERFLARPGEETHEGLWRRCAFDLDRVREAMGERWQPFEAANVEQARTPSAMGALGSLMAHFAAPVDDPARVAVPVTLIWGRHDLATRLEVAQAASLRHGWPLHVIEDCADDPPIEQPDAFLRALGLALGEAAEHGLAAAGFGGEIVGRAHPRYDELRRVFNAMIDRRPALIARCVNARDVATAVGFARDSGMRVSVYGGGHNVTGNAVCEDGVTIDLRPMKGIEVDPDARTCRAEAGPHLGRARRRDAGARPRRHGRPGVHDRPRRARARRRLRVARALLRPHGREPDLGGDRHGGRAHPHRLRERAPGPLLGHARRRREPRRGHQLRAPAAPDRPDGHGRPARSTRPRWRPRCCGTSTR